MCSVLQHRALRYRRVRTEIDDVVPGHAKACEEILFQAKPSVIRSDSHAHAGVSSMWLSVVMARAPT
jgi:hypothetical protein